MIEAVLRAIDRRAAFLARARTDCVRLFVGSAEGAPGVTVDRYGPVLLIQSFEDPIDPDPIASAVERALGLSLIAVWNHRPAFRREGFDHWFAAPDLRDAIGDEEGMRFVVDPRAAGLDPPLFLDLRAGRRAMRELARGDVLNLFAYTCGLGIAAAVSGARVLNVDFARSALAIGERNAALNGVEVEMLHEDAIPVVRQLAGLPIKGRGARRPFTKLSPRTFDVVALDPPRWSKSPFGAVDVARDYPTLLKPAMLATAKGGALLATNHVPSIDRAGFETVLRRTAQKIDREIASFTWIECDEDVPRSDGPPPLKIARLRLR